MIGTSRSHSEIGDRDSPAATRHLYVVAQNSSFAYKGKSPDIREVDRALGVRYVLEGSVRRVDDKMRTTVQLIEAETGAHLWGEKYDRPHRGMFDVQDEVVRAIAGALSLEISQAGIARIRAEPPSNLGAWELVQRTMYARNHEPPSIAQAREELGLLERAVALDGGYAFARAA